MKFVFTIAFIALCFNAQTQTESDSIEFSDNDLKRNELKLNLFYSIFSYPEISYERIFYHTNSSLGFSFGKSFTDNVDLDFSIIPFYRLYFSKKTAAGFFVEGSGLYALGQDDFNSNKKSSEFGVGIALGGKLIRDSGWHIELVVGIGRVFEQNTNYFSNDPYPRMGVSLGKRFW